MSGKRSRLRGRNLLLLGLCGLGVCALPARVRAQSAAVAHPASAEMDAILFVQSAQLKNVPDAIELIWIPQPIQRLCVGKTDQQCASIDYCIRTTNRNVSMCRNLGMPLSRLPSYPRDMVPRRQLSVTLMRLTPDYFPKLQDFYHRAPKASLERLSLGARVKARVRFTRKPDDDDFEVLEILAVVPF
jgi:hypothetical protein